MLLRKMPFKNHIANQLITPHCSMLISADHLMCISCEHVQGTVELNVLRDVPTVVGISHHFRKIATPKPE